MPLHDSCLSLAPVFYGVCHLIFFVPTKNTNTTRKTTTNLYTAENSPTNLKSRELAPTLTTNLPAGTTHSCLATSQ